MGKFIDLTGQTFGRLTALNRGERVKDGESVKWECCCACGNKCIVPSTCLRSGHTKSCGCIRSENMHQIACATLEAKGRMPEIHPSKMRLEELYDQRNLTATEIAKIFMVTPKTVLYWMRSYGIPVRSLSQTAKMSHVKNPNRILFAIRASLCSDKVKSARILKGYTLAEYSKVNGYTKKAQKISARNRSIRSQVKCQCAYIWCRKEFTRKSSDIQHKRVFCCRECFFMERRRTSSHARVKANLAIAVQPQWLTEALANAPILTQSR